jgi:hypothetical protein
MTGRPPARALPLLLLLAGCQSIPTTYAPPIQRRPVYGPEGTELTSYVAMNDARVQLHIESGVSHALQDRAWRWTNERAELKFALTTNVSRKFRMDFAVAEDTFRRTGPITLSVAINGNVLDKVRYDAPGQKRFEKPVPSAWLRFDLVNHVVVEVDKPWVSAAGQAKLGIILVAAGFVE